MPQKESQLILANSLFVWASPKQQWAQNFRVSSENFYVRKRNKEGIKQGEKESVKESDEKGGSIGARMRRGVSG